MFLDLDQVRSPRRRRSIIDSLVEVRFNRRSAESLGILRRLAFLHRVRVGIISDTHGYYHPEIDEVFAGLDLILHAGDVGPADVLDRLEKLAPVQGVYGNIDGPPVRGRFGEHLKVRVGGMRIWVTHIGGHPKRWAPGVGPGLRADPPDLFICGHSHILRVERVPALGGMLYINPGAAGRQGFHQVKTCIRLKVEGGSASEAEVIHLADPVRPLRTSA